MKIFKLIALATIIAMVGCDSNSDREAVHEETHDHPHVMDVHSFANFEEVSASHVHLNLNVDMDGQLVSGSAVYTLKANHEASEMVLDIKSLNIEKVTVDGAEAEFELGDEEELLGQPLTVSISPGAKEVAVHYSTTADIPGVQWLTPEQADSEMPFMYTQGEAILTRSWIPIQDSPNAKLSFSASVSVPEGVIPVMSATGAGADENGVYQFNQKNPIPPYLIALAVGELEFESISERCGVYAPKSLIEASKHEFADLEKLVQASEQIIWNYDWERYDLLVLPRAFPFGGMENPQLTFVTPTIIAGDGSLIALIAHELAHSWSGNTVTNATWDDFWLNEGFTVYLERRIVEAVYGKDYADMHRASGYADLLGTLEDLGEDHPDTKLKLDLIDRDPDDGMTDVAYEKGALFLEAMEAVVGREEMDAFLRDYFSDLRYRSIVTEDLFKYLTDRFGAEKVEAIGFDDWVYGTGLPESFTCKNPAGFEQIDEMLAGVKEGSLPAANAFSGWNIFQYLYFLRNLPADGPESMMADLDARFKFSASKNSEIVSEWLKQSLNKDHAAADQALEDFLMSIGRRKFLAPLYRAMLANPRTNARAHEVYLAARGGYHSITTNTLDEMMANDKAES